jgi:predicted nucleic acid-binding protein
MKDRIFIDTNIWVYLYSENLREKQEKVEILINNNFNNVYISNQVLGELYYTLTRKNITTKEFSKEIIENLINTFSVLENKTSQLLKAININLTYQFSYWDSLILATAIENDCNILYTEDMHHNQLIENKVRIVNPFKE